MDLEEEGQEVCSEVYAVGHWCELGVEWGMWGMWGKWGALRG